MGVLLLFFIYWIQFWDYEYLMHTLNILSLNVTVLNSAVKRTCVLEHLHRKSISGALICNTTSSGTFLHMFWECPVVIDLWTHVNLVLSSSLQTDCFANPSLCLLNDDSGLFISLIQKRRLFVGFAAAKRTMIQNWYTPHGIGTGIDWTFNIWSMCLLFCFVCFEWMLCCVWKEIKKCW